VSADKDGVLRHLQELSLSLPYITSFTNLYTSLRTIQKQNKPDETEALTPFLLGHK
jgi:hypothetical protein